MPWLGGGLLVRIIRTIGESAHALVLSIYSLYHIFGSWSEYKFMFPIHYSPSWGVSFPGVFGGHAQLDWGPNNRLYKCNVYHVYHALWWD